MDYPSSDGQPMAETELHVNLLLATLGLLKHQYRRRPNVYVARF